MAHATVAGRPFRDAVWIGTEGTEHDVDRCADLMPLAREGGLRAIWFGIEDMTAELVKTPMPPSTIRYAFSRPH